MDGKVALVTGGAEGIGAAVGRLIVAEGGSVMLADLHQVSGLTGAMMLYPIIRGGFPIAALVLVLVATRRRRKVAQ